jgi:hypothetical protein
VSATGNSKISPTIACQNPFTSRRAAPTGRISVTRPIVSGTISAIRMLCQLRPDFQTSLDIRLLIAVRGLLNELAIERIEGELFHFFSDSLTLRRRVGFFP